MRLLHLFEEEKMKISEVHMQEAEPNYETNPAQARLAAIAVKLMDKAETTSDENLQIALSRVATHLPEYGTAFGAKNMQELLDIVNGEGRYAPDPDMPQDNKNPIKITKDSLMKMMAFGQKMVDKEGTVKVDIDEDMNSVMAKAGKDKHGDEYMKKAREMAQKKGRKLTPAERDSLRNKHSKNRKDVKEDVEDYEKVNARRMIKQLRAISEHRRILENMIIKLADMNKDSGDLTDQLQTMFDLNTKFSAVLRRAMKIVPVYEDMNEAIPTSEFDYDIKKFYDKVMELEDQNQHGKVAEMLVNLYGTGPESMVIRGINGMHSAQGSIMPEQQKLRDMISTKYYKKLEQEVKGMKEGVISDLFKASTAEKRAKEQTASAYDAMRLEKTTKKFEKQGLSPEDARKYAYRKVYGKPLGEGKAPVSKIHKAVDDGKSMDAIVGMFANKGTTNTDDIRKIVKDYKFKSRMKK